VSTVTPFAKWRALVALLADPKVSASAKNVGARLLWHHNGDTGKCCPSYETLGRGVALSRRRAI
jgi:hypothetical protein